MYMPLGENGSPIGLDDSKLRKTEITISGVSSGVEPEIVKAENDASIRPYEMTKEWDSKTNTLKITVLHNGIVEFNVSLNNKKSIVKDEKREPLTDEVQKNNNSTKVLEKLVKNKVTDSHSYTYYTYLNYDAAYEKAKAIISEGTYSKLQIVKAERKLKKAQKNLIKATEYSQALNKLLAEKSDDSKAMDLFDSLLRELLSAKKYVNGRSDELEYSILYKSGFYAYSESRKESALEKICKDIKMHNK